MAVLTETLPLIKIEDFSLDDYVVTEVVLDKALLRPSCLVFKMRRKTLLRNDGDIYFEIAEELMGANVTLTVKTQRRNENMDQKSETLTFSGIIFGARSTREAIGNVAYIEVTAYSADYLLVDNPHCSSFEDKTLEEIVDEVIGVNGKIIKTDIQPRLTARLPYTVQYNETSYQFISRLAQRFGEYFFFDNDHLYFGQTPQGRDYTLYPDIDVLGYSYQLGMEHTRFQHGQHDYLKYNNTATDGYQLTGEAMHQMTDTVYEHSSAIWQKATLQDMHSTTQEYSTFRQNEVSAKAEGYGAKARMMTCKVRTNRADISIGDRIVIEEYSDEGRRMKEEHQELLVIAVNYRAVMDGHFENELTAVPSNSPYAPYGVEDLYAVCESQRAQVVDNKDPEHLGRIRVQFLWQQLQEGQPSTPWLRIAQPHGGDDKGFYFIPEEGEEVMVAFENGNGEKPYVVGTLYHGRQHPGKGWPNDSNDIKAIRTRNGHTVEIHDVAQGGFIRIYDYEKENYILTYSTDEKLIKLESTGNIELYADNDIIMHAKHDIKMTADNDINETAKHDISQSADNDFYMSAGNDMDRTAQNNIREYAGNNRNTTIDVNDSLNIGENQFIKIGDNKDEQVSNKLQLNAENIRVEANDNLLEYSKIHHQKAEKGIAINASDQINIKAAIVKVN